MADKFKVKETRFKVLSFSSLWISENTSINKNYPASLQRFVRYGTLNIETYLHMRVHHIKWLILKLCNVYLYYLQG